MLPTALRQQWQKVNHLRASVMPTGSSSFQEMIRDRTNPLLKAMVTCCKLDTWKLMTMRLKWWFILTKKSIWNHHLLVAISNTVTLMIQLLLLLITAFIHLVIHGVYWQNQPALQTNYSITKTRALVPRRTCLPIAYRCALSTLLVLARNKQSRQSISVPLLTKRRGILQRERYLFAYNVCHSNPIAL